MTADPLAGCPAALRPALCRCLAGELSPLMTLLHLLLATGDAERVAAALAALPEAGVPGELRALLARHGAAAARVAALCREVLADAPVPDSPAGCAALFDRLARTAPEAAVALYSLGDPGLLAAATGEVVALLDAWGVLAPGRRVVEIGCGIGRFAQAPAGRVACYTGIDVAPAMIAAARQRCAGLAHARFAVTAGRDLALLADRSVELVLAIDSMPYLRQAGRALVARHLDEAARILRPGGDLVILNYAYRDDLVADRAELAELARAAGLRIRRNGTRELGLWDAAGFHLALPG